MWGSIAASVAGSVISGAMSGGGAGQASQAQDQASAAAVAEQRRQFDLNRADLAPYRTAGTGAINRLSYLMGIGGPAPDSQFQLSATAANGERFVRDTTPMGTGSDSWRDIKTGKLYETSFPGMAQARADISGEAPDPEYGSLNKKFTLADFWDDPVTKASYQQGLDQGTKALTNMAGARGSLNSGAQLKALTRFSTDYTGGQAAGSQARYVGDQTNTYNRLSGVSGTGQTAATNTAAFGQQSANNIAGLMTAQGNARGAAAIAQGNAYSGAAGNIGNMASLYGMMNRGGGGGGGGYNYGNYGSYGYDDFSG